MCCTVKNGCITRTLNIPDLLTARRECSMVVLEKESRSGSQEILRKCPLKESHHGTIDEGGWF